MRRHFLGIALACALALGGPVGQYLGLGVGNTRVAGFTGRDSLHVIFPLAFDTVFQVSYVDTSSVTAETTYGADPAWLVARSTGGTASVDTFVESGDTLLRQPALLVDTLLWYNRFRVPFEIGTRWATGVAGTYYLDLNGDSLEDTLSVWGDTTAVTDTQDVSVPFGDFEHCWLLYTEVWQAAALKESIFPIRETTLVRSWTWYKDSFGPVKDSLEAEADAYVFLIIWFRAGQLTSSRLGELHDFFVLGLQERDRPQPEPLACSPNPSGGMTRFPGAAARGEPVRIFDSSGRLVRTLAHDTWDGLDNRGDPAPAGIYLARSGVRTCAVTRLD